MSQHSRRGPEWQRVAERIKERDGYVCQLHYGGCTVGSDLTVDHWWPVSKGGTDDEWNLLTACRTCNGRKRDIVMNRQTWFDEEWFSA